ncbi:hypothetical protein [Clostridium facile]|uniref:hypothetical protein n=1 Tax=Clostridium facile TaxID=2763035 RepID=UPI001A9AD553|nr:hypothetical protein [Clostridium facile]
MLPETKVVKAIESLYCGTCSVYQKEKQKRPDHSTSFVEKLVLENQPCRLSFSSSPANGLDGNVRSVSQSIKLFLSPNTTIAPGSKIVVTQHGKTIAYKSSGIPSVYRSHQEINLELFQGWA